jgi:hypothetical protein
MFPCKYQVVYFMADIWFVYSVNTPFYLCNTVVCVMLLAHNFTFTWIVGVIDFRQFRRSLTLDSLCGQIADISMCISLQALQFHQASVSCLFSRAYKNMLARRRDNRTPFTCW